MAKKSNLPPPLPLHPQPSPYEQTELTNTGQKPRHLQDRPGPVPANVASDAMIANAYPSLGDEVRIDVDRVSVMNQGSIHNALRACGAHGQLGRVVGQEIISGVYMLKIQTAHATVNAPADCVALEPHPIPPVQDHGQAPERMRKPSTGAYKLT